MYIIYKWIIENIMWKLSIKHTTHNNKTLSFRRKTSPDMPLVAYFEDIEAIAVVCVGVGVVLC